MNDFRKFKSILGTICKKKKRVFRKKKFKKGRGAWLVRWGGVFSILIYNVPKKLTNQKHLKPMFSILIYPFHVNPYFKWLELEVIYLRVGIEPPRSPILLQWTKKMLTHILIWAEIHVSYDKTLTQKNMIHKTTNLLFITIYI